MDNQLQLMDYESCIPEYYYILFFTLYILLKNQNYLKIKNTRANTSFTYGTRFKLSSSSISIGKSTKLSYHSVNVTKLIFKTARLI